MGETVPSTPLFSAGYEIAAFLVSSGLLSKAWEVSALAYTSFPESFIVREDEDGNVYFAFPSSPKPEDLIIRDRSYGECNIRSGNSVFGSLKGSDDQPAHVHEGALKLFLHILKNSDLKDKIDAAQKKRKNIVFVGHSLGGAIAALATLWILEKRVRGSSPFCITFGSPLVGDARLVQAVGREKWGGQFYHVVSIHDIVPRLLLAPFDSIHEPLNAIWPHLWSGMTKNSSTASFTNGPHHCTENASRILLANVQGYASALVNYGRTSISESDDVVKRSPYRPFGAYIFCSKTGAVCFENPETVLQMLHFTIQSQGDISGACISEHTGYGAMLQNINEGFLNASRNANPSLDSSYKVGIALQLEAIGVGAQGKIPRKRHVSQACSWETHRSRIICILATAVETDLKNLYGQSDPEENFLAFVAKGAFSLFENPALLKDTDTKDALCRIIGACATKYHYTMQSSASILHLIHKYEFLPQHIADAVAQAEKMYMDGSLAIALIREIGRMNPKDYARDASGAENVGRFLVELADRLPKLMSINVGILVPHFGGESYKIRSSLVGVFGKLIAKAFKDSDGNCASGTHRLRSKQAMLDVLLERCRDVSAYTRSRVLQMWGELCEEHAVSIGLWNQVSEIAAGRLEDKSAMVRKSALTLLITLLQYNPFGPQLRTTSFEATLEKYKEKLSGMTPDTTSNSSEANGDVIAIKAESPGKDEGEELCKNDLIGTVPEGNLYPEENGADVPHHVEDSGPSQLENGVQNTDCTPDVGSLEQTRALVASLEAGLRFAKCMASTMPVLVQLLASSVATDVENAIQFLMRCRQFQIDGAESCLRKMLPLVFSQEKAIYEAVEAAFVTIYMKKNSMETAANLVNITIEASIGDLAALEFIVSTLVTKGDITSGVISALWDFFTFNVNGVTAEQSRGALSVLCMAAKSSPKILSSRLLNIIDIGFGRWAKEEPLLARTACIALQRLSQEDRESLVSSNSRVFNVLQSLITGPGLPEQSWYAAAEQAINAIYALHPMPEAFLVDVIRKFHGSVFGHTESIDQVASDIGNQEDMTDLPPGPLSVRATKLSRYLFAVSHVALKHLVYVESCVRKIRKQKADKERAAAECQAAKLSEGNCSQSSEVDNINAELGVSASEDARLDALSERAEKEIISGRQNEKFIIGICAPVVAKLCRNLTLLQKFSGLQASAMLALCKLMVIDADFCDSNLQLLFTVAQNAATETVRSNCTIALGDLTVRFPNLLEPWTEHMYARLHDQSLSVRKNAVLVLSHLILNDMMKVKGYISEMALRLEDEDTRIASLVKLFFHELSQKGNNPIYNLLPDILSRLSSQNLPEETFCNIMQFLIGSIKKDKQMEGLIEKLCHRFCGIVDRKQWVDIAYCLSQLTYTEKGIKKLADLFKSYEHALSEDAVIDYFRGITTKAKKFAKPELKASIDDFEDKLVKCHEERKEQEITTQSAIAYQQKVVGPTAFEKCREEASCVTESEAQADCTNEQCGNEVILGATSHDMSISEGSTGGLAEAPNNVQACDLAISETRDIPASRNTGDGNNVQYEISPSITKSCRKGKQKGRLKKNVKLEVHAAPEEAESFVLGDQMVPARVCSEKVFVKESSSVAISSVDSKGVIESNHKDVCDHEERSEITSLEVDCGDRVGKGSCRPKKTGPPKSLLEGLEGAVADEEKENRSRQIPSTPSLRSCRKARPKEKIPTQTMTLRKR